MMAGRRMQEWEQGDLKYSKLLIMAMGQFEFGELNGGDVSGTATLSGVVVVGSALFCSGQVQRTPGDRNWRRN